MPTEHMKDSRYRIIKIQVQSEIKRESDSDTGIRRLQEIKA